MGTPAPRFFLKFKPFVNWLFILFLFVCAGWLVAASSSCLVGVRFAVLGLGRYFFRVIMHPTNPQAIRLSMPGSGTLAVTLTESIKLPTVPDLGFIEVNCKVVLSPVPTKVFENKLQLPFK